MQPESRKLLTDALCASTAIQEFTENKAFADLGQDNQLRSAIYYQFVIIGEAISQLRQIDSVTFDRISESSRIVGFRNQIIHGYSVIQNNVTWQIIQDKLPLLITELKSLLNE